MKEITWLKSFLERIVSFFKAHKVVFVLCSCAVCFTVPAVIRLYFNVNEQTFLLYFWGGMAYQASLYWIKDNHTL